MEHVNTPAHWQTVFPRPQPEGNKYDRGHAIIVGGGIASTGAAKLAAFCALRTGAGLVSVACDLAALPIYGASFQAIMTKPVASLPDFKKLIADTRVKAVLLGPGAGITPRTKHFALAILKQRLPAVFDADALTVFAENPAAFFASIQSPLILTPHDGEFHRLFGAAIHATDRVEKACLAAKLSKAVVILKGNETMIASPDGRWVANPPATPYLATAGAGDALAGICTGLLAQGMPAYEAACAAVWMHSAAAKALGPGLIADDIAGALPAILQTI